MVNLPSDLARFKQELINYTSDRNQLPTCLDLANRTGQSFSATNQLAVRLVSCGHAKFNRDTDIMAAKLIPQFHELDVRGDAA